MKRTETPDPTRIVADTSVLVADIFLDNDARAAMDLIRSHSWLTLIASQSLLTEAKEAIGSLGTESLATDWESLIDQLVRRVDHPANDHPALASAYAGRAGHLLTYDERLLGADTSVAMRQVMPISIRTPAGFVNIFDAESLYRFQFNEAYPGPDADPRV